MGKAGFGGEAAGGSLQFTLTQSVDEAWDKGNAVALATCEVLRDKMVSPPRHCVSDFTAEPAGRRGRIARHLSTAAEKCAIWRRKSVPVGLIKKGTEALLIDARCEPREA